MRGLKKNSIKARFISSIGIFTDNLLSRLVRVEGFEEYIEGKSQDDNYFNYGQK